MGSGSSFYEYNAIPGLQGPIGPVGPTGPQGNPGPTGNQGAPGPIGPAGPAGAPSLVPGPQGVPGNTGPVPWLNPTTWTSGTSYTPGPPAALVIYNGSTYVCTSANTDTTFNPSNWSLLVSPGPTGVQGPPGSTGPQGSVGPTGSQGPQGIAGPQGPLGATGPQGIQGTPGATGAQGPVGPQGPAGTVTYGTTAGTAAQGNDSRITGALQSSASALPSSFVSAPGLSSSFVDQSSNQTAAGNKTWTGAANFGANVYLPNNNNSSTNRLYLAGADANHYLYSTGAGGNTMVLGEYQGNFVFRDSAGIYGDVTIAGGNVSVPVSPAVSDNSTKLVTSAFVRGVLPYVTPEMFGAKGDGTTDDSAALQAMLNTGLPCVLGPKTYYIKSMLTMSTSNQWVRGSGRYQTTISVDGSFATSSAGVVKISAPGNCGFADIGIVGAQPNSSTISGLVQYPPFIFMQGATRVTLERILIANALTGIDARGNCGGAYFRDIQMSCYQYGARFDGSVDSVRISDVHAYVFYISNTTLQNNNVVWFDMGRIDDLKMTNCLTLNGTGINFYSSASQTSPYNNSGGGASTGSVVNHDFDTGSLGINMSGGDISVHGGYTACSTILVQTGGYLSLNGMTLGISTSQTITQNNSSAILQINGCMFLLGSSDYIAVLAAAGWTTITNSFFSFTPAGQNLTNPKVKAINARLTFSNNICLDRGSGTGNTLVYITNDIFNRMVGNAAPGWSYTYPTASNSVYANN